MLQQVRAKQQEKISLDDVQKAIQIFQMHYGHLPNELTELVERGVLTELPAPPQGTRFFYDRIVGNVRLIRLHNAGNTATNQPVSANLILPTK